jgi:PAS domain S-box-containing protein
VISDNTLSSQKCKEKVQEAALSMPGSIKFNYLREDAYMEDILAQVRVLPPGSVVILMSFFKDREGKFYTPEIGGKMIAENSTVPVYSAWDFYLGHGITGGLITSSNAQGEMGAKIALRVVNGEKISDIPISREPANYYMFDYNELKRFSIKLSDLPEGSIIINRPYSFYSKHKVFIWVISVSMASLALIILLLSINIIYRKRAEEALRQSEEHYRTLVEESFDGIFVQKGPEIIFANQLLCDMLGYEENELEGMDHWLIYHPDYQELIRERSRARMRGDIFPSQYEVVLQRKDGTSFDGEINARAISLNGEPGVQVWVRDITERKRSDEALKESEERYRSLVNSSTDAILMMDNERLIVSCNQAFLDLFGYEKNEIDGKSIRIIHQSDESFRSFGEMTYPAIERTGTYRTEWEFKRKDGTIYPVETVTSVIKSHDGEISGYVAIIRGTAERKRAEEEKKKLEAQLLQAHKMEAIGTLAGGIAHDFNNILQAISGYTQILMMQKGPTDPDYDKLEAIENSTQRAGDLAKQLLIFGRKLESKLRPMDLNHEVMQVSKMLERTIPKMISIELHMAKDLKIIDADPVQLEQIMMNLGVNARDAMPDGGKLIFRTENIILDETYCKIHPGSTPGEYVLLTVLDTGHGMDGEILEHIFEPFFTTKETGRGTGLGLAMVYGIVKSHGGHIMCYSEPGMGSTFKTYFPVLEVEGKEQEEERGKEEEIPGGKETILLVDDEEIILDIGQETLGRYGYTTIRAESGEKAIEIYGKEKDRIDLIILDLNMPGMGGHKCLIEILRTDPGAKIMIASGYSANAQVQETLESGAIGFVSKPFRLTDMLKKVREVLDRSKRSKGSALNGLLPKSN